ncbi:BPL-N domain-containing protein [Mesorhizobium sp. 1M-11]|uniref:BPL-N domain-containing protein n=1 Tax=Mesorhizobium sp. 1M-11 TaxID=1529006 RepID=UPI0006C737C6|nr:BPL-N domain-containing protein [Mesorhizobium sp. 1M-11]
MKLATLLAAATILLGAMPAQAKTDIIRVAVYRGPASCEGCAETARTSIEKLDPAYRVEFVGKGEKTDISPETLSRFDIYVQPGGGQDIPGALRSLGKARVRAIRDFVAQGGGFLGLCMGAYLADRANFGLIPHDLDSEVGRPGFPVKTIEDAAVRVSWAGRQDMAYFQDGPYLPQAGRDKGFRQIAAYENRDIAAARYSFKKGTVVLSGPHPEADKTWFEDAGLPLEKMPKTNLLKDLLSNF